MFNQPVRLAALLVAGLAAGAWAQAPNNVDNEIERGKSLWNPPAMMKQACDGISKHYKLDAKQRDSTSKLLTERVTKFLGKHERQLWPLLMELTEQQIRGKEPSKETSPLTMPSNRRRAKAWASGEELAAPAPPIQAPVVFVGTDLGSDIGSDIGSDMGSE